MPRRKPAKRENGAGSVYRRSDTVNRPWVAAAPAELQNGRLTRVIIGHFATQDEAKEALAEYVRVPIAKPQITLQELYTEWCPIATRDLSKSMQNGYAAAWKKLAPLYTVRVRDLRTAQMQKVIDDLCKPHPTERYGKIVEQAALSHSALSKIRILLNLLFKYAMQNDIVNKNYAEFLRLPKEEKKPVKDCFSDLECARIERAVGTVPYADWILCMIYTGFRISEFLSLTPFSVKETDGVLVLMGGNKTEAGRNRLIPVHPKIRPIIEAQLARHGQTLFCRPDGSPMTANYFRNDIYYAALKEIGVRQLSPHATRRTFSTRMSAAGVRQEDMIALMGHADFSVDIDHYIKQSTPTLAAAIEKMR